MSCRRQRLGDPLELVYGRADGRRVSTPRRVLVIVARSRGSLGTDPDSHRRVLAVLAYLRTSACGSPDDTGPQC